MKKLFFLMMLAASQAFAAITELKTYKDLDLDQIDSQTLVIFDIDNTLIRQNHMIGTHQWGDYIRDRAIAAGIPKAEAQENQYRAFAELQPHLQVVPVENEIFHILKTLQAKKVPHFALTARSAVLKQATLEQLRILNHDFASNYPKQKNPSDLSEHLYNGVIFSGDVPKGELLKKIIANSVVSPQKVIFVDDKKYNLDSVENSLSGTNIMLQSLRYGAADSYVEGFDPVMADLAYSFFKENRIVFPDKTIKSLAGDLESIVFLRFDLYLADLGPLAKSSENCILTTTTKTAMKYECDYTYDGVESRIQFDFKRDPVTKSIYFGQW